jgi:hypothetical protein
MMINLMANDEDRLPRTPNDQLNCEKILIKPVSFQFNNQRLQASDDIQITLTTNRRMTRSPGKVTHRG